MKAILLFLFLIPFSYQYYPYIVVYYESLCPGCQSFIKYSYTPFYNSPEHYDAAMVEFVPFGNAFEDYNRRTGLYEFDCQHGENEVSYFY